MSLRDYLDVLWRRKFVILAVMALGLAAATFVDRPDEPTAGTFDGEVTLAMSDSQNFSDLLLFEQVALRTNTIINDVAGELGEDFFGPGVDTALVMQASVDVSADPTVGTLQVFAISLPTQETTERLLIAYGDAIIDYATGRLTVARDDQLASLQRREESILARIDELDRELGRLSPTQAQEDRVTTAQLGSNLASLTGVQEDIAVLQDQTREELVPLRYIGTPETIQGEAETSPLNSRQQLIVGLLLAAALGVGLALALQKFDARLYARKDAEQAFGLPVLAEVPKIRWWARRRPALYAKNNPASLFAESYRLLRSGLAHARTTQLDREGVVDSEEAAVVIVTSVSGQVGKTTTVSNLAVAAVDAGMSVLVVGADLREPTLHHYFDVDPVVGITDAVRGQAATGRTVLEPYLVPTVLPGVSIVAHGEWVPNPGETLAQIRPLLDIAKRQFDLILIDTPPMLAGNDVSELVPFADLVLLVARAGRSTMDEAQWAEETSARLEAPLCGVVLIGSRSAFDQRRRTPLRRLLRRLLGRSPDLRRSSSPASEAQGTVVQPGLFDDPVPARPAPEQVMPLAPTHHDSVDVAADNAAAPPPPVRDWATTTMELTAVTGPELPTPSAELAQEPVGVVPPSLIASGETGLVQTEEVAAVVTTPDGEGSGPPADEAGAHDVESDKLAEADDADDVEVAVAADEAGQNELAEDADAVAGGAMSNGGEVEDSAAATDSSAPQHQPPDEPDQEPNGGQLSDIDFNAGLIDEDPPYPPRRTMSA